MANPRGNPQNLKPFQPGNRANPGGKPIGARNRLAAKFLYELASHFEKHGKAAIQKMYDEDPAKYVQAVAALVPKDDTLNVNLDGQVKHEHSDATLNTLLEEHRPAAKPAGSDSVVH